MNSSLDRVLRANIEPTADEKTRAQRAVDDKTLEISEIGSAIEHLHAALSTLYDRQAKLFTELEQLKSVLSPIRRVPLDLIGEIFLFLRPGAGPPREGTPIPWALALVCRSWRETALGISRLWSVLDMAEFVRVGSIRRNSWGAHDTAYIRYRPTNESDETEVPEWISPEQHDDDHKNFYLEDASDRLQTCLVRSRNRGLAIVLGNNRPNHPAFTLLFETLIKEAFRWESVTLISPSQDLCRRIKAVKHRFGRLRRMVYNLGHLHGDAAEWDFDAFGPERAPNLIDLDLQHFGLGIIPKQIASWSSLKKFREGCCSFAPSDRVAIYRQLTNLVVLHIDLADHFSLDNTVVAFPNLRVGCFNFVPTYSGSAWLPSTTILSSFDMPNLEELAIQGQNTTYLSQFMPRCAPQLRKVSLAFRFVMTSPGDTERVLALYPNLRDLSLWGPHYLSEETLRCLTPGQSLDEKPLLPQLEIFRVSSYSFVAEECHWTTLLQMVRGRFAPPKESAIRRLRTFQLAYYEKSDPSHWDYAPGRDGVWDEHVGRGLSALAKRTGWDIIADRIPVTPTWSELGLEWVPRRYI
uniref:F-box domain-containing protein n=1 Tax=Mycena chlorophos TaxID=658473 RepID=A0ABQ0MA01_MYCCL|nr:predicted protein [Mycena chlorophos]